MEGKVSIIITVCNRIEFLDEALNSAFKALNPEDEVIVVNDGSVPDFDEQIDLILANYSRIEYIRIRKNQGVSMARNVGIERATGEFLLFLDDDDILDSRFVNDAREYLIRNRDTDVFFGKTWLFSSGQNKRLKRLQKYQSAIQSKFHAQEVDRPAFFLWYMPAIHAFVF